VDILVSQEARRYSGHMNILVTGVAGFLGSHVSERLRDLGHKVRGIDNLIGGYRTNIPDDIDFHELDLNDYEALASVFQNQELVIHAACTAYEGLSVFSPAFVTENTFQISMNTLSWAIRSGARKFVYLSSMARYGEQSRVPFTEEMTPRPQDPYGIAKYAFELVLQNLSEVHGIDYTILVPHNIIGPKQKYDDPYRNVASIMVNRILQGKQPIIYGDGNQQRCFSFIDDVVEPLIESCFSVKASKQTINIGPDEEFVSINELAKLIGKLMSFDVRPIYFPDRPQEVKFATCSAEKARQLIKYRTSTTLEKGLSDLILWISEQGPREFSYHIPLEIVSNLTPRTWTEKQI